MMSPHAPFRQFFLLIVCLKLRNYFIIVIVIVIINHHPYHKQFERGLNNVNYCKDHRYQDSSDEW